MFRFAADENLNNDILRGVQRQHGEFDVVRIQDTEIAGADDPKVLEWAANEGRILLTHDVKTMPTHAYQRLANNLPLSGVFIIPTSLPVGSVINELMLIIYTSTPDEWSGRVMFLPL